jgi:Uncharacterized protein conserved in bacteria (DUF2188)
VIRLPLLKPLLFNKDKGFIRLAGGHIMADTSTRGQASPSSHFYHVSHHKSDGKWHVKEVRGNHETTHDTKEKALEEARRLAKQAEHGHIVLHREDGSFETVENE